METNEFKGNSRGINAYRERLVANIVNPALVINLGIRARYSSRDISVQWEKGNRKKEATAGSC